MVAKVGGYLSGIVGALFRMEEAVPLMCGSFPKKLDPPGRREGLEWFVSRVRGVSCNPRCPVPGGEQLLKRWEAKADVKINSGSTNKERFALTDEVNTILATRQEMQLTPRTTTRHRYIIKSITESCCCG